METPRFLSFDEFMTIKLADSYNQRVIFIRNDANPANLFGPTSGRELAINLSCASQLFITYSTKDDIDNNIIIPADMPVLYYGGNVETSLDFIEKYNIKKENMYNLPEYMKMSGSKVDFAKMFNSADWLPKTVFSKEEAIKGAVGFPVIAKISNGHSGLGIKKFDSAKDLKKDKKTFELRGEQRSFDLFSQFIDFDREYRCMFIGDKCFVVNERVPIKNENISIRTKKVDEKVKFIYAYQDFKKIPTEFIEEVTRIAIEVSKKIKLDLWSLDIVVDRQGKIWVLETNSSTGLGSVKLCEVYMEIFKDFYGYELPNFYKKELWTNYMSQGHLIYWPLYKKEIESTLWPIDYAAIQTKYPLLDKYDSIIY